MENGKGLKKAISLPAMIAMAAGGMVAAWMVEIKYWFEIGGAGSFWSLATCAVLVLPLCFIYSEMTSTMPYAGGETIWATNAFGWNVGFIEYWLVVLLYVMAMPTVAYGIASMVGYFTEFGALETKITATVILILWYFLTNAKVNILAKMQNIFFYGTMIVSVAASIIFIFSGQWSYDNITPWFEHGFNGYTAGIGLLIMKFVGFDLIPQLTEESTFPRKDVWKAFVGSLGCTVLIYGLAIIGVGGIVSSEWIAETDIVDPRVADIVGMHWLGVAIVVMGTLTCITTLSSFWLAAARTFYGAAEQHQVTPIFAKLNKNGQPRNANIIVGLLSIFFCVFAPDAWINYIYTIYGVAAGLVYLVVVLSFMKLRKSRPDWERPFKIKGGMFWGVVGVIFCLWIIYTNALAMDSGAYIVLAIYTVLGIVLWAYAKAMQKKKPDQWAPVIVSPDNK